MRRSFASLSCFVALLPLAAALAAAACSADDSAGSGGRSDGGGAPATSSATSASTSSGDQGGGSGEGGAGGGSAEAAWQTVLDQGDLDGAVLSVWGSAPEDVYAVGGPLGNSGFESLIVHFDGTTWRRLHPGGAETYWWVGGSGAEDVWMVGEQGRITHWDGASFAEHDSGVGATLWGVWAASPDDAWAVGGTPNGGSGTEGDIVLHWDGGAWTRETLPGAPLGRALFKVWGTGSDNLYVVGEKGTVWHREGTTWGLEPSLTMARLFTVSGCGADEVYAVGGFNVLRSDGQSFSKVEVMLTNTVNGVACGSSGSVALVGFGGLKERLVDGTWINEFTVEPFDDLHAAWAEGAGAFWAVGGDFSTGPVAGKRRKGVVARYGAGTVAGSISP